ncbi:MAG TPA: hypothetical protein VER98_04005 [Terriglobia bacterium]|nr:hypothetical protein [Terriglobia bacterium]
MDATKVPTPIDIAWSAGVYEGEGTARLCGRGKRSLAVSVPQKDPEILYTLRDLFGGSVNPPSGGNPCYKWDICGDRARIFISLIYSFLSSKRRAQVDGTDALEFLRGTFPEGLSIEDLAFHLAAFYDEKRSNTWRGENRSEIRKANYRKRKAEDPDFLARLVAKNREWKAKQVVNTDGTDKP